MKPSLAINAYEKLGSMLVQKSTNYLKLCN